jgi:Rod binding domain-containing protein
MTQIDNIQGVSPVQKTRDKKTWDAAAQFEKLLVEQLAKQMQATVETDSDSSSDEDGAGKSAAAGFYSQLLPGALADGVTAGGGLGLQQRLYDAMSMKGSK